MKVILKDNYYNFSIIPETEFEKSFLEKFMEYGNTRIYKLYPYFGKNIRATFIIEEERRKDGKNMREEKLKNLLEGLSWGNGIGLITFSQTMQPKDLAHIIITHLDARVV